jgi:hypothetical protein
MPKLHQWRGSRRDFHIAHAAQQLRPARDRFRIEDVAHVRMAHAQRQLESRALEGAEVERLRLRGFDVEIVAIRNVPFQMMPARLHQHVVQSEALRFGDAPWRDPLAAHVIGVHGGFFKDSGRDSLAREHGGKRTSADSAADYHDLRICLAGHQNLPDD